MNTAWYRAVSLVGVNMFLQCLRVWENYM